MTEETPCPPGNRLLKPVLAMLALQVLVVLLLGMLVVSRRQTPNAERRSWEYKVEQISPESYGDRLNQLGKDHWELVSSRPQTDPPSYEVILRR